MNACCTQANNHTIYKAPGFGPTKDFDPVTLLTSTAALVVARPGLPVNSMAELTTLLKANQVELLETAA